MSLPPVEAADRPAQAAAPDEPSRPVRRHRKRCLRRTAEAALTRTRGRRAAAARQRHECRLGISGRTRPAAGTPLPGLPAARSPAARAPGCGTAAATDVEAVGEATAEELSTEREQRESDACKPSLPLPVVHPESVPAG